MPVIQTAPDLQTWYRIDDFTDPWTDAPWVVLMHGVAENSDAWYAWIPHLARRYRVLRLDVRGFGRSSPMPRDYAWSLLSKHSDWWEPGALKPEAPALSDHSPHIFFRILIASMSGREATD